MPKVLVVTKDGSYYKEEPDFTQEELDEIQRQHREVASNMSRLLRNDLLKESDWTQVTDSALSDDKKAEWTSYRTQLRDLPNHANWPELAEDAWPTKPS